MAELTQITETLQKGNTGRSLNKLVQEWLNINGNLTMIDGQFGPATEAAVKTFQSKKGLPQTGKVNPATFEKLVTPMLNVMSLKANSNISLRDNVVKYAKSYLAERPIEVGGQNKGPWVRYFMDDNEGDSYPWCAGFVTYLLRQASKDLSISSAITRTYSCDILGEKARNSNTLIKGSIGDLSKVKPGHIFLVRKTNTDWTHTGIVIEMYPNYCVTIEGNTNDEGSREGYEVCKRTRAFGSLDFIIY
jgi:Putative peptidoglycan binding domain